MLEIISQFKNAHGIDLIGQYEFDKNITFAQRAMQNLVRYNQTLIKAFVTNIE